MTRDCDVLVMGGGVAGSATAIALARSGCSVTLIEPLNCTSQGVGEALPPETRPVLARLGLWDRFRSDGHLTSFGTQACWGGSDPYENNFLFSPYGSGWCLDRAKFNAMMFESARAAGARTLRPANILLPELRCGTWHLDMSCADGAPGLRARFLVDATGRRASIARAQGARSIVCDRLLAIVGRYGRSSQRSQSRGAQSHCPVLIEAVENGWWYSASIPGEELAVAYLTDSDQLPHDRGRFAFWPRLMAEAPHTWDRVRNRTVSGQLFAISAHTSCLEHTCGPTWLAVGDAAASLDPLSSHGIHKSLLSGVMAAQVIQRRLSGDQESLREYTHRTHALFTRYLQKRMWYYERERRWPQSKFWARRSRSSLSAS